MRKGRRVPPAAPTAAAQRAEETNPATNECIAVAQQAERQAAVALLAQQRTPALAPQVAEQAAWIAAQMAEQLVDTRSIACRAGCAWCCSLFVSASPPEVLRIADYLRATRSAEDLAALRDRLAARELQFAGKTAEQRSAARMPCVLLEDQQCSIYPVRPLACSSWTSTDARRCEQSWQRHWASTISANQMQLWLYGGVMLGLREGLDTYGLESDQLDLSTALRIALDTPDAAARWLEGEPIFTPARIALRP